MARVVRCGPARLRRFALAAGLILATAHPLAPQQRGGAAAPQTRAERTGFTETSRYDDVMAFLRAIAGISARVHLTTFGYSFEGRPLPLVVAGDVPDATAQAVTASGRLRVLVFSEAHGGEVEGKEALLMLLRDVAAGAPADWIRQVVLLAAPVQNPDATERITLANRARQHGPVGGVGARPNAQGLDLNRDYVKLETPEARSLVMLLRHYDPHVVVDLHGTNGTRHAYAVTYAPPLSPNGYPAIADLLRQDWFPTFSRTVRTRHGWDSYYYGNVPGAGGPPDSPRGWYTFDPRPRYATNYVGLRNRIGILGETYSYLPFEDRIRTTRQFVEENLNYAAGRAARIQQVAKDAEAAPVVGQHLAVRATLQRTAESTEILLGDVAEERHPYTGQIMLRRTGEPRVERMPEFQAFAPSETERVPAAYYVPETLAAVLERLAAHGVRMARLEHPETMTVEQFRIASAELAPQEFQGHREHMVTGQYESVTRTLPAGTIAVPMDQPLARLVFSLLEPRSDDGFLYWNFLDDVLKEASVYPIVRRP